MFQNTVYNDDNCEAGDGNVNSDTNNNINDDYVMNDVKLMKTYSGNDSMN